LRQPDPRGAFLTVDGRHMHVVTAGPPGGAPLVLLEAGAFGFSADWAVVQARLAARALRSLAYDRAGLGLSDPGPSPRDGLAIAYDLERLLAEAGEAGPYLLVGHSMAGLHTQLFAGRNRDRIAGLVLVDAITPLMARDRWFRLAARPSHRFMRAAGAVAAPPPRLESPCRPARRSTAATVLAPSPTSSARSRSCVRSAMPSAAARSIMRTCSSARAGPARRARRRFSPPA